MKSYSRFINELNAATLCLRRAGVCRDIRRAIGARVLRDCFDEETRKLKREAGKRSLLIRDSEFTKYARRMKMRAQFWIRMTVESAPVKYPMYLGRRLQLMSFRRRGFDFRREMGIVRYEWRWSYIYMDR